MHYVYIIVIINVLMNNMFICYEKLVNLLSFVYMYKYMYTNNNKYSSYFTHSVHIHIHVHIHVYALVITNVRTTHTFVMSSLHMYM